MWNYAELLIERNGVGVSRKTKPKDIGTKAETDVVNWARVHEFWKAERIVLHGTKDHGDVKIAEGVMVQVKDGYTEGREATDYLIGQWLEGVDRQVKAGGWEYGLLTHKRVGKASPDMWRWYIDGHTFKRLVMPVEPVTYTAAFPPYVQLQGYMIPSLLQNAGILR